MTSLKKSHTFAAAATLLAAITAIALVARAQSSSHEGHGGMTSMPGMEMPGMEMPGMQMPATPTSGPAAPEGLSQVTIAPAVQQRIGVTFGKVEQTPLVMQVRTVGIVRPDETKLAHVHLKTEGWVTQLFVSFTGQKVKAGDPLLTIYSPAFFAAQRSSWWRSKQPKLPRRRMSRSL